MCSCPKILRRRARRTKPSFTSYKHIRDVRIGWVCPSKDNPNASPKVPFLHLLPKNTEDPVHIRRAKFISKLEEQKQLLEDPGFVRTVHRTPEIDGQKQVVVRKWGSKPRGRPTFRSAFNAPDALRGLLVAAYHNWRRILSQSSSACAFDMYSVMHVIRICEVSSNSGEPTCQSSSHSLSRPFPRPGTIRSSSAGPSSSRSWRSRSCSCRTPTTFGPSSDGPR
jgi:hypothetical protein